MTVCPFFVFAIRLGRTWLRRDEALFYADALNLPLVPVCEPGFFDEQGIKNVIFAATKEESVFGGIVEGMVIRKTDCFAQAQFSSNSLKYVRENHVQTDVHWTRNWRRAALEFEHPPSR